MAHAGCQPFLFLLWHVIHPTDGGGRQARLAHAGRKYVQSPQYCGRIHSVESLQSKEIPPESDNIGLRSAPGEHAGPRVLEVRDCGLADYREILHVQQQLCDQRREGRIPDTVLILEHPPVITLGAHQSRNRLLATREHLGREGIDIVSIHRGGGATAHNPGQVVFYPILNLEQLKLGISQYVRRLETIGAALLAGLGVNSVPRKGLPGLWVGEKKIASIGVRVSKMTTCHGMAINIQNDLSIFDLIVPCGLEDVRMTSVLDETGHRHQMGQVKESLAQLLREHFATGKP